MHCFVNKKKYCQICTCPMWFYFTLLDLTHFCNEIEKSVKYSSILRPMKNNFRFEYVPWKNLWFCFIAIVWVLFSHRTKKFRFWKSLKYFKRYGVIFEYFPWKNGWFCFSSIIWVHFSHKSEKVRFWNSLKYFNIFWWKKEMVADLNMSHWKMSDFVSFPLLGFTLVIKLRSFDFEGH